MDFAGCPGVVGYMGRFGDRHFTNEDMSHWHDQAWELYLKSGGKTRYEGFKCLDFQYKSAPPPTCPESCTICSEQFVPSGLRQATKKRAEMHDDNKAASTINDLIEAIQTDFTFIRTKIETHGNAIVKRWQKKNRMKREQILRIAMPNIPAQPHADMEMIFEHINHISDVLNLRVTPEATEREADRPEDPHLAPFLNVETLSEDPMRLLALLHHRSHAHLSEWIPFDRERIQIYFSSGHLEVAYNPHCVIVHGEKFGSLVPWSKDVAHRWQAVGYPLARQLFRVQAMISGFLRKVVSELLSYAVDEAPRGRDIWDDLAAKRFRNENFLVVESAYYNQMFATPLKFDLDYILKGLELRVDAALDDSMLFQADPSYLRRQHKGGIGREDPEWLV